MNFQLLINSFILLLYNQGFFPSLAHFCLWIVTFQVIFLEHLIFQYPKQDVLMKSGVKEEDNRCYQLSMQSPVSVRPKDNLDEKSTSSSKAELLYGTSPGNLLLKGCWMEQGLVQDAIEQGICSPSFPLLPCMWLSRLFSHNSCQNTARQGIITDTYCGHYTTGTGCAKWHTTRQLLIHAIKETH